MSAEIAPFELSTFAVLSEIFNELSAKLKSFIYHSCSGDSVMQSCKTENVRKAIIRN